MVNGKVSISHEFNQPTNHGIGLLNRLLRFPFWTERR